MASFTLNPVVDTFINSANPGFDYGQSNILSIGKSSGAATGKALIRFTLPTLPAGVQIQSATLSLKGQAGTTTTVGVHRSLVTFYEGPQSGAAASAGVNASTWNHRNHNGSVAWAGGAGGGSGSSYSASATSSVSITTASATHQWNVLTDVSGFYAGTFVNEGWWVVVSGTDTNVNFDSTEFAFGTKPTLTVTYKVPSPRLGLATASASATGRLAGKISIAGTGDGNSSLYAKLSQPGSITGLGAAAATAEATLRAAGNLVPAAIHGTSNVAATGGLSASGNLATGHAAAGATVTGAIMSRQSIAGTTTAAATASASITMVGFLRGVSAAAAETSGTIWGKAVGKVPAQLCENTPLLYITDGSFLPNGQMDLLDLLQPRNGFLLKDWLPAVAPYKGGGYFSDSALGSGRRLSRRVFDNAIEVMTLTLKGDNHNNTIWFARELLRWQELAADYWTSDWSIRPVYLVARSPREEHVRYAIVHVMSISNFGNPYSQPFFSQRRPAMENLTLRIERDPWTDTQPGEFEPVPISSIRSYTIADWGAAA